MNVALAVQTPLTFNGCSGCLDKKADVVPNRLTAIDKQARWSYSKADDEKMYSRLRKENGIKLLTVPRQKIGKSERRQTMIAEQMTEDNREIYKKRSTPVEPMQGLIKDIFGLEDCWMRGDRSNRWIFAAMSVAVQMAQHQAVTENKSTWRIKAAVCGV